MQCEICRKPMKEYNLVQLKYADGGEKAVINESEPIYFIHKNNMVYKGCGKCWRRE